MHYYQHHIGDLLKDTSHLSNEQLAVYLRMLWKYYLDEKPLDDDCEGIAFAVRSDEKTVRLLLKHYFIHAGAYWRHDRCDKEIAEFYKRSESARNNAKARWNNAGAMRAHSDGNADASKTDATHIPNTHIPNIEANASVGKPTLPPTPVQQIIDLYNEILPELPAVKLITEKRKREAPKFWRWVMTSNRSDGTRRAETFDQGVSFIRSYFERAKENDFVMGRTQKTKSHETWQADFDYLISESGRIQVVEKTK